jgi:TRAP-type C4-dicarboxylate transport system permease small subunit
MMDRFFRRLIALIEWWAALLLALMVVVVCLGVFFRYVLNSSLVWYDEFASYLLVWLTFYGAVVASYRRRHIGFEVVADRFEPKTRRIIDFISECFVLSFQFVLFYYGWVLLRKMGDGSAISLTWIKMGWVYSVLPITGGLMLLISSMRLIDITFAKKHERGEKASWSGSASE